MSDNEEEEEEEEEEDEFDTKIEYIEHNNFLRAKETYNESNGVIAAKQDIIKQVSRREKRRQIDRRAKQLLSTPEFHTLPYIANLSIKYFLSPDFVLIYQILLISVYGTYSLMALLIMIFYILDFEMTLFDDTFIFNASWIMIIFFIFNLLLSIIGFYTIYIVGISKERVYDLERVRIGISENSIECEDISNFLVNDGDNFLLSNDIFVDGQGDVKYELSKTLHRMHKLGVSLKTYGEKYNNDEINKLTHFIQMIYQSMYLDFIKLRALQDRSKIIRLFYKKQLNKDKKIGLNKQEFVQLKEELDNESNDKIHEKLYFEFPDFQYFDTDNNGNVSILEFEHQLNAKYNDIFKEIELQYTNNKTPEDLAYEKEEREKEQTDNLLDSFKKYIKK